MYNQKREEKNIYNNAKSNWQTVHIMLTSVTWLSPIQRMDLTTNSDGLFNTVLSYMAGDAP